jgi:Uma2 family endonuclease
VAVRIDYDGTVNLHRRKPMIRVMNEEDLVSVPEWVTDLESFRRWTEAEDFPEKGNIGFLNGAVWVDMSKEQVYTHVLVKTRFTIVLGGLVEAAKLGMYLSDGVFVSNVDAGLSVKPDGTFVSNVALDEGRVRQVEGMREGILELEGSPDMVLEVVSQSSVRKDKVDLRSAYWEAGVREYWLVDARREPVTFDILRQTSRGFTSTRKRDGWLKSDVFGKQFRLVRTLNPRGNPEVTLEVR